MSEIATEKAFNAGSKITAEAIKTYMKEVDLQSLSSKQKYGHTIMFVTGAFNTLVEFLQSIEKNAPDFNAEAYVRSTMEIALDE